MSLNISNCTKQDFNFHYRLAREEPAGKGPQIAYIPSGGQIPIGERWNPEQKAYVIRQLETHGAKDAAEIHASVQRFTGILYRDDGIISEDEIRMGHDQVVDTQERRSATEAMRAVEAFDYGVNARGRGQRIVKTTEMSIKQEVARGERPTGKEIDFTLSVEPEGRTGIKKPLAS